ncbi:MAG: stage III sporulation AC/AD family protein [Acutalibacteraceae bacterium]|nr:stage III sporulation AC/AD family protein [Acutalibacteraceae bacterium]
MDIVKIAFLGIITALLYALVRNIKPEMAPLVILGGCCVLLVTLSGKLAEITDSVGNMTELAGLDSENIKILLKALGICIVTQFAADICYDNSCSSVAAAVELSGRVGALILALPMLETVASLGIGLING